MSTTCESTDFMFPLLADVYYALVKQNSYGQPQKDWIFDRSVVCSLGSLNRKGVEDTIPNAYITMENKLVGRIKNDIRFSSHNASNPITSIIITNIRSNNGELIYRESAGPRSGRGTIYEVATLEPFIGPSNTVEYYKVVLRRAENQAVGD